MQRFSLYRVHKVYPRTDGTTHARTHGTTAALLYPHRNALRGDKNKSCRKLEIIKCENYHDRIYIRLLSVSFEKNNDI